jgi:oligoendopeptidase F
MNVILKEADLLEGKLKILLEKYEFLLEENELLNQSVVKLQTELKSKNQITEQMNKEMSYLKIARTMEGSNEDTRGMKLKINTLIREIDQCIVQLSE